MAQPYVGEIRMFGGNFAPAGWMFCEGQLLPISENETLFNLIGTTYGGDGQSNFALPDLQGRTPMHHGQGPVLSLPDRGEARAPATFSLLGTTYGGDGKSNFALPDLQGRTPMHPGQGPGLSLHDLGETGGSETVTLLESEIPAHSHALLAAATPGNSKIPGGNVLSRA